MSTLVALGDSVTVGVGDAGVPAGWAAHVAWALEVEAFTNVARLGARASDVAQDQFIAAKALRPDIATVLVGGNDVLRGDFSALDVGAYVERTVDGLHRQGADVLVVLLHDPRRTLPGPRIVREVLGARAESVNCEVRRRLSGASRTALVDPTSCELVVHRAAWSVDRLHPSALGHRALAELALGALRPLGWKPRRAVLPPAGSQPSAATQAWWLLRHGTPWCAKRSRDLLPELALVCWRHRRAAARA
jgi:lysophospholipase L1-like esterase